jgi:hypothetical protein
MILTVPRSVAHARSHGLTRLPSLISTRLPDAQSTYLDSRLLSIQLAPHQHPRPIIRSAALVIRRRRLVNSIAI